MPEAVRVRFAKVGKVRFTGHRDVVRMWERALRRSGLPVAWSQGFSPRPLLSFGLALPTGSESVAEYLDVRVPGAAGLEEWRTPVESGLAELVSPLLPEGVDVLAAAPVPLDSGSLQQEVTSCTWELEVHGLAAEELGARIEWVLASKTFLVRRERKGRKTVDDIRSSLRILEHLGTSAGPSPDVESHRICAELATRPTGVRPEELVEGIGLELVMARARRTQQWIERDGVRMEPLAIAGSTPYATAPGASRRAS